MFNFISSVNVFFASPTEVNALTLAIVRKYADRFRSPLLRLVTDDARRAFDERIERLSNQHGIDYVRGYVAA